MSNSKSNQSCILLGTLVLMLLPLSERCQARLASVEELHREMMVYQLGSCRVSKLQNDATSALNVHNIRKICSTKGQN